MRSVLKDTPLPVRLSPEQKERLARVSKDLGISQSVLMRWAIQALLQQVEEGEGKLVIPFRIEDPR
jgi:predicted DNA-binding protein